VPGQTRKQVTLASPRPSIPGAEWFTGAGLGLFIHWDHASQLGVEISWPQVGHGGHPELVGPAYNRSAASFRPWAWDAVELAALAVDSGFTYAVLTTRHHAGYAMFHTEHSALGLRTSGFDRDVTREYVDAFRAAGLRVGLYYSLADWSHPDYPAVEATDLPYPREHWPYAGHPGAAGTPWAEERHRRSSPESWARFLDYVRRQLTHLLTDYGPIDLLWFDGQWERSAEEWRSADLRRMIKNLQPHVLINDRLPGAGDYETPEQGFPTDVPEGPWELCLTMGEQWSWRPDDTYKSARSIVTTLIEVVARGGNLLLNIGPRGDGSIDPAQRRLVEDVGRWMRRHRESVIGVSPAVGVDFPGPTTARDDTVYLHLQWRPVEDIVVRGLPVRRIRSVTLLATGEKLPHTIRRDTHAEVRDLLSPHEPRGEIVIAAPEPSGALVDVVAITFTSDGEG
jgi:alpha-L-fucosidase